MARHRHLTFDTLVRGVAKNLKPKEVYNFMVSDFEDVWDSVAHNPSARGRGNFLFAILAMAFLEFTCRLSKSDAEGTSLPRFSKQLHAIDKRYFIRIPGLNVSTSEFELPFIGQAQTNDYLLSALFDLIRNGIAHQYQQILVGLKGGRNWGITLTGPKRGRYLDTIQASPRSDSTHLTIKRDSNGDLWLTVNPARLFLDFRKAFDGAQLLKAELSLRPLIRPDPKRKNQKYDFSSITLEGLFSSIQSGTFRK